jgi:pimeloyl-ACP methyl ester carboxylesterase
MPSAIEHSWVEFSGHKVHYVVAGNGHPVVMVHGGANDWSEWSVNIGDLAEYYRIYALDLPGFGLSRGWKTRYTYADLSSFMHDFVDAIGLDCIHLIGHSLGGRVCLEFALTYPQRVRRIVLVDSTGLARVTRLGLLVASVMWIVRRLVLPRKPCAKVTEETVMNHEQDYPQCLARVQTPTLVIWGQKDIYLPVVQARRAYRLLPDARLKVFPRCGHAPHRQNPGAFKEAVLDFLAGEHLAPG